MRHFPSHSPPLRLLTILYFCPAGIMSLASDGTTPHTMHYLNTSYISMILFVINFVLIYIFGILTFMVKKIHPVPQYDKVRACELSESALPLKFCHRFAEALSSAGARYGGFFCPF